LATLTFNNEQSNADAEYVFKSILLQPIFHSLSAPEHVLRLYRRALRTTFDWYPVMSVFREKQFIMRQLFEQNRNVASPQQQQLLIEQAEALLVKYRFHIPYASEHLLLDRILDSGPPLTEQIDPQMFTRRKERNGNGIRRHQQRWVTLRSSSVFLLTRFLNPGTSYNDRQIVERGLGNYRNKALAPADHDHGHH